MQGILNPINIDVITLQKVAVKFNVSLQLYINQSWMKQGYFESLTVVFIGYQ